MNLKGFLLRVSLFLSLATPTFASINLHTSGALTCGSVDNDIQVRGGPVIWPWGSEISIDLSGLQGLWKMSSSGCSDLYIVKVIKDNVSESIISITQYDPVSCRPIASGKGYIKDRVIRAVMAGGGRSFGVSIHAFRPTDVRVAGARARMTPVATPVYVMRKYIIGGTTANKSLTAQIDKLTKNPSMLCE